MGQQARRDKAAPRQQSRRNHTLFHRDVVVLLLTAATAVNSLDMLYHFVLGRHIGQFPPYNALSALVQRASTLQADTLRLRQLVDDKVL